MADRALTIEEVAREYGVSRKTIYRWLKARENPLIGIKLPGGTWRFRREHLEAFERCHDTSSRNQLTDSASEEASGQSTIQTRSPVTLEAYRRGRESARGPRSGGTNG